MTLNPELVSWAEHWYPISWYGVLGGGLMTALGAVATIAFLLLQWRTTSIREEQAEFRTSTIEFQTAEAKRDTALAQEHIAELTKQGEQLRKETAEANERAAEAKLALERFRAPRKLSHDQLIELTRAASKWSSVPSSAGGLQSAAVFSVDGSYEAAALADQIADALANAKWSTNRHPVMYGRSYKVDGVGILTSSHPHGIDVAEDMARVLGTLGISAFVIPEKRPAESPSSDKNEVFNSSISIIIGEHPR